MTAPDTRPMTKDEVAEILANEYAMDCDTADPGLLMQVPDWASFQGFGRLILKMALGELDPARIPDDVMRDILKDYGIAIPDDWSIQFTPRPAKTFIAMYPAPDMAKAALCRFQQDGADYQLPPQYAEWVGGTSTLDKQEFYEFRVGDYTLNYCR
ncbi:MAG: hypothetical protein Q8K20_12380 [Gemmobacter sp.]|nr:hypothetical protein [Gemmobacter sp.]